VQVFDLAQNDWERRFAGFDRVTHTVAFSPDGSLIAFAGASGKIFLQETETGDEVAVLEGHINEISSLAFSPDGQTLASGSYDESTILWDVRRERQIEQFYGHIDQVFAVAFSPDGRLLATGDASGSVIVWNVQQAEQVRTLVFNTAAITDLAFSPDNRFLAISSRDGTVQLIEVEELLFGGGMRQSLYETFDLPGYGFSVAFSPDGSLLLGTVGDLVNSENVIYVWDVESGDIVTVLRGHKNWAMSAQFSPDGSQIASASLDGSIRLWSLD
jgi:WD40 repeat protein